MFNIKNERGSFELTTSIAIFLVCLIIALSVAAFHYWYFPSKYLQFKSNEIAQIFSDSKNFSKKAKQILNVRNDISYIKLLNRDGLVEHSFGTQNNGKSEKFVFEGPGDNTIIVGIKHLENQQIDGYALLWSLIIGSIISVMLLFVIFLISPPPDISLKRLIDAMKKVSEGKFTKRLDISPSIKFDSEILGLYTEFNSMTHYIENFVGNLKSKVKKLEESSSKDIMNLSSAEIIIEDIESLSEIKDIEDVSNDAFDELVNDDEEDNKDDNFSLFSQEVTKDKINSVDENNHSENKIKIEVVPPFKPKIVPSENKVVPKNRNVTVLVAKISEFENLTKELDPSDLNGFITQYRSSATDIISEYGGVVEAILQDEIVAIFNAPEKQKDPELRSVSVAVEIMQLIADLTRKRRSEGKEVISLRIGIGLDSLPFSSDNEIPDGIKDVVDKVRSICNKSDNWKILVSGEFYKSIKEYVEVKEEKVSNSSYFSIVGVEEGVVNL